jgi:prevent-host-death family protein
MRIATVSELRRRFSDIIKWIDAGEEITITRYGKQFAVIRPIKAKDVLS